MRKLRLIDKVRLLVLVAALAIAMPVLTGCSSQQDNSAQTSTTQTQSSSQSNQSSDGHDSLLGATAHFIWTVVAFPFRVVGDVIGEIV